MKSGRYIQHDLVYFENKFDRILMIRWSDILLLKLGKMS